MRVSELLALPAVAADFWIQVERQTLTETLNAALDRREALLLQDDTDEAIASVDTETDRLNLALERLDAVENARRNAAATT